jgi:hypothetical protein
MNNALTAEVELARHQRCSWWTVASLSAVTIVGLIFVAVVALPYFNLATLQASRYWPRRWWLLVHIASGIVALLTGPVQLWLGLSERRVGVHHSPLTFLRSKPPSGLRSAPDSPDLQPRGFSPPALR